MHARVRDYDWAATPLGPVPGWPYSLKSLVKTLLASRYPMVLTWGPHYLQFYNDAYSKLIGDKHPSALGNDIRITLAEGWDTLGPLVEQVMTTGVATWVPALPLTLERSGYREEAYFTVSHAPAEDDEGQIVGMLAVCSEVTQQVLGERRFGLLHDLALKTGETQRVEAACQEVAGVIGAYPLEVPFALIYLRGRSEETLTFAGSVGLDEGHPLRLPSVGPANEGEWAQLLAQAAAGETVLLEDVQRYAVIPGGPWGEPVRSTLIMPLDTRGAAMPGGVMVAGVNPNRALDEGYRSFYALLGGQVSAAVRNAQAYEEERRRAEALAELDRVKTTFFSNISHEFRTPLTLMLGPVEDLLGRASSRDPRDLEQLSIIRRNGLRLLKLVNTLLDFSRIEANRMDAVYQPTALDTYTADLASTFESPVEAAGLRLVVDCPPLSEPIYVDRDMWETIVLNLLSNAFKFTFEGSITIALREEAEWVALSVCDTGTGIPAAELPHVFERFQRVRGTRGRSVEGTGIGLALVQELVRLHGGQIEVESREGEGSCFHVRIPRGHIHLPAAQVRFTGSPAPIVADVSAYLHESAQGSVPGGVDESEAEPDQASVAAPTPAPVEDGGAPRLPRILLADDNADMRAYVRRLLADHYEVEAVGDGRLALQRARQSPPDLVVSDVMMPELDGVALLQALRADPRTASVPVVLLSARAGESSIVEGLETGADDYLVKPFSARELLARVRTHLELARARRQITGEQARRSAAEAALRERDIFLALASHELRTPLTALQGFAELLERRSRQEHRFEERDARAIRTIRDMIHRLNSLTGTILDLSRIHAGQLSLDQEPMDIGALVRRLVAEAELVLERHTLRCVVPDEPLLVLADALRLEQVFQNLLQNAVKYSPEGGAVEVQVERRGAQVCIAVRDEGVGIPADALPHVFERFYRADNIDHRQISGLGMGLFVVREIVLRHEGTVEIQSVEGQGSAFTVCLPAYNDAPPD